MKKIYGLILCLLFCLPGSAQYLNDGGGIDLEPYNFGFSLGLTYGSFDVIKRAGYQHAQTYEDVSGGQTTLPPHDVIRAVGKPGFSLGLLANLKLHRNFDLRFTPNILFVDRDIEYVYRRAEGFEPQDDQTVNVRFTNMQYPLLLKFKSNRQGNVRAYLIGGVKYSMDVTSGKKYREALLSAEEFPADEMNSIFIDRGFFAWEAGIGVDLYYEFFKCSPELKFSRSFSNTLYQDDNRYSRPLAGLFTELVQFTLHFE